MSQSAATVTGKCYCGKTRFLAVEAPLKVAYCHCQDCRRVTGAPVAAFAAFSDDAVSFTPGDGRKVSINAGVTRTFCEGCGTSLTGRYDYLPGKVFIALGLLDQAEAFAPELHAHCVNHLSWLQIDDELERHEGSARLRLESQGT